MRASGKWVVLWSLWAARLVRQPTPPVRVSGGWLRGSVSPDGSYAQYSGVPYAVNQDRFQAPAPAPTWDGVVDAINEHIRCTQSGGFSGGIVGQDDCLTLNIYTPLHNSQSSPLPVMVFIHGGGFIKGSSTKSIYGPDYLMSKGVVLVTINYRLNVEGFLNLGIKEAPGNAGMKDQVAALRWVQKNIRAFGGDPDNVTIFGESAGGASVSYHVLSPMSKGLFHKAILQSGSSLSSWSFQHDPFDAAISKAKNVGYIDLSENALDLYKFFMSKTSRELLETRVPRTEGDLVLSQLLFTPSVEQKIEGVEPFLTETPYKILSEGRYNKVPLIIGSNSDEGLLFMNMETDDDIKNLKFEVALPKNLIFPSVDERKKLADEVHKLYLGDDEITVENRAKLSKFAGEPFFNYFAAEETGLIMKTTDKPVYHYLFDYDGWKNVIKLSASSSLKKLKGASHADELFYLFSQLPSMFENKMIEVMTTLWTNFAKYGDPTPAVTDLLPVKWPAVRTEDQRALVIDKELSISPIWQDRLLFWRDAYAKYRRK
ncbi:esterase FE4-like [Ostrinia nubilalis]|uniref:esterase FE4-like n=1 Tax=Ostrinia nubilalis TaxID=29057 RepID=UPI00308256A3